MTAFATATLLASGLASIAVAAVAWRNRPAGGATYLAGFALAVGVWSLAHLLAHAATGAPELAFRKLMWAGIAPAPFLFVAAVLEYVGRGDALTRPVRVALFGWPALLVVLLWVPEGAPLAVWPALDGETGLVYWGHLGLSYALLAVGSGLLVVHVLSASGPFRSQGLALLAGVAAAWVGSAVSAFELFGPVHFHALPVGLAALGGCLLWGVTSADLLSLVPVAERAVVERLSAGVVAVDPDGRVTRVNPAAKRLLGLEDERVVGRDATDAFEQYPELAEWVEDVALSGGADPATVAVDGAAATDGAGTAARVEREASAADGADAGGGVEDATAAVDGTVTGIDGGATTAGTATATTTVEDDAVVEAELSPLRDERGRFVGWVLLLRDVTDRRRRARRLERQNERLERFTGVVSHDLRNPLNVAAGRLAMVRDEHDSDHLDAVARSHDRMENLIEDLLTVARQGERDPAPEPTDLARVARESWAGVETPAADLDVAAEATVEADPRRLRQLLENLFRNAVEHGSTSPGSQAPESAERGDANVTVTVGDLADGFYVEDDGVGIPADERDRVFESGYSTAEGGTGLGLDIVEEIASAHGWDVTVTEGRDGGARFEVRGVDTL